MNIKKQLSVLTLGLSVFMSTSAMAGGTVNSSRAAIPGVAATLKNIETVVNAAVAEAEQRYIDNRSSAATSANACGAAAIDLLNGGGVSPYVSIASVRADCFVEIQLSGSDVTAAHTSSPADGPIVSPVAGAMQDVSILLVPIFNQSTPLPDQQISAWECITDFDRNSARFIGEDLQPVVGGSSRITSETTNAYLAQCIYDTFGGFPAVSPFTPD